MKRRVFAALLATVLALICLCSICLISCNKDNQQEGNYLLKFKSDGANYDVMIVGGSDGEIALPQDPKKSGYSFAGWYLDDGVWNRPFDPSAKITADIEVYAKWMRTTFAISYELNGGAYQGAANPSEYSVESNDIVLLPLVREGYAFDGWFLNGNYVEKIKKGTTGNLTLSAKWVKDGYTITYTNVNGVENNNPRTYTVSDTAISLAPLEKIGYTFEGWYSGDTKYTSIPANSTGNLALVAKWSLVDYSITYLDPEGIVLDVAGFDLPTNYTIESETIVLNSYYLPGFRFEGWVDGDGIRVSTIKKGSHGNVVLYAEMSDDKMFSITFVDDQFGKSNPENPTWYTMGEDSPELKPLEKLDYDFVGWTLGLGDTITEIDTSYGGNITLYAVWKQKDIFKPFEYTVSENDDWCILTGVNDNTATSLVIPDVFDMIAPGALKSCRNLEELDLAYLSAKKDEESHSYLGYFFGAENNEKNADYVPTSLKKVAVKSGTLGENAFFSCKNLEEIEVAAGVTAIGKNAYYQCEKLKTLTTPIYLDGANKFYESYNAAKYYGIHGTEKLPSYGDLTLNIVGGQVGNRAFYQNKSIKNVTVSNVSNIGACAFQECVNLENFVAESLQEIERRAFRGCTSLKKAVFPDGIPAIREYTFLQCTELVSVTVPQTVQTIEDGAFDGCFRLVEVYNASALKIEKGSTANGGIGLNALDIYTSLDDQSKLSEVDGILYRKGDKNYVIRYYGGNTDIVIDDGTQIIYENAFEDTKVETVVLPDSLEEIRHNAFNHTELETVNIPRNVTKIGDYAFSNNRSLTSANIADCQITELSHHVFYNCALESIYIPDSITKIGESAFERCDVLRNHIELTNYVVEIGKNAFNGCDLLKKLTVPFIGSTRDDENAFSIIGATNVKELFVLSGDAIRDGAFEGTESLEKVVISDVKIIGSRAFSGCKNLNTVEYSAQIEKIGAGAFENTCIGELRLPYLGDEIDDPNAKLGYYFGGENNTVPGSLWHVILNSATVIPAKAFESAGRLTKIELPATITKIGERAFANTAIGEFVLDEKVTEIGFGAFAECNNLSSITLPFAGDGKTGEEAKTHFGYVFGANSYEDHTNMPSWTVPRFLKNVTILGGTIARNAFFKCDVIETITLGANISEIDTEAFTVAGDIYDWPYLIYGSRGSNPDSEKYFDRYGHNLGDFIVSGDNAKFKTIDGVIYSKDGKTLVAYPSAKSDEAFTIPDGVVNIGACAFLAQRYLKSITIGNDTEVIGGSAFAGCGTLSSITFGTKGKLVEIGGKAFKKCESLRNTHLVIPEGVKIIHQEAFVQALLASVTLPSTLELIGESAFSAMSDAYDYIIFNTTSDWFLESTSPGLYGNRVVDAETLEDKFEARNLLNGLAYTGADGKTYYKTEGLFYTWHKKEKA